MEVAIQCHRLNFKVFVGIIIAIGFLFAGLYLFLFNIITFNDLWTLSLNYGFATALGGAVWAYFEYVGWRRPVWKWIRLSQLLGFPPDLRGRWEGVLDRDGENNPHPFVVEIVQTMTTIQVTTYSSRGGSESILDEIARDKSGSTFWLCFYWHGEGGRLRYQAEDRGKFVGYTALKLIINEQKQKSLEGHYFTNRKPKQTMGTVKVRWVSLTFKNKFE